MAFLTLRDFQAARKHIEPHVHRTPTIGSETLSRMTGFDVVLKAELLQKAGSYKVRGPLNVLANMSEEAKARGLITSSAGNHAQGVARAARIHGVPAVVVMSKAAKPAKIEATRDYGAEVVIHGEVWDDAYARSLEIMKERNLTYVHPFDDPQLIAGQGLVGLEMIEDVPDLDVVVVPIGGGGLIAGCAMAIKAIKPDVRIIGVEAKQSPAMRRSLDAGQVTPLDSFGPMIDGLVVKRVGDYTFDVVREFVDDVVLVDEERIFETVILIMERLKLVPEAAAAAPVAAILDGLIEAAPGTKVGCILSGGNLDLSALKGMAWN
ncbi:threonine ammonia-lyase [Sphingosinicella rhizophila]|uniref:Threonine/serine dehydratase n=1 Tax=Sphingosinicella rhizophila TaxID=3050082 RepID=A0ABU3Q336_9SPHN|nr:threonine/serine dehydratase [Sphingosinicella sp. GR2756]MDT9597819.1 threonine/serine dehydratase [Sphingosinicella sp. GR2756]